VKQALVTRGIFFIVSTSTWFGRLNIEDDRYTARIQLWQNRTGAQLTCALFRSLRTPLDFCRAAKMGSTRGRAPPVKVPDGSYSSPPRVTVRDLTSGSKATCREERKVSMATKYRVCARGVRGLNFGSGLLLPPTGSGVKFFFLCYSPGVPNLRYMYPCYSRIGFCVCWRIVNGCFFNLYLCRVKWASGCICRVSTGSGTDSDWKFAKQDWILTQKKTESAHL